MFKWCFALVAGWLVQHAQCEPLRIGFGSHKPPYVFENEARGLEYDLVVQAAQRAGFQVLPYYAPQERLHLMLRRGEIDAITTTNRRSGVPAFYSDIYIYYHNQAVALARSNYQIDRVSDLSHYSISTFQRARLLLGEEFATMAASNPRYREEAQQVNRNRLLYSGRVDVVVGDRRIVRYFDRMVSSQVDVELPLRWYDIFPPTPYRLGFRLDEQRLRFNAGLRELRESGEYQRIEQRYDEY